MHIRRVQLIATSYQQRNRLTYKEGGGYRTQPAIPISMLCHTAWCYCSCRHSIVSPYPVFIQVSRWAEAGEPNRQFPAILGPKRQHLHEYDVESTNRELYIGYIWGANMPWFLRHICVRSLTSSEIPCSQVVLRGGLLLPLRCSTIYTLHGTWHTQQGASPTPHICVQHLVTPL
jgi:hypothetical protein